MLRNLTFGVALCAALSACGGGSTTSGLPPAPTNPTSPQSVKFSIRIPGPASAGAAVQRRPLYISTKTNSASIAVNGGTPVIVNLSPSSPNCTGSGNGRVCTVSVNAPVGTDTFSESLYQSADGTGPVLSLTTTSAAIKAGVANVVNLVLSGVIASLTASVAPNSPPAGQPATIYLTVNFLDAAGENIIGSDPFATPVSLTDSDTSGATKLSLTTLKSPSDTATITYNGQPLSSATITATSGSASAFSTLTPVVAAFNDYTTFGFDNQRDVYNPNSVTISPASIAGVHTAWQAFLGSDTDYNTQTQPVLATQIPGHKGVLFVGGGTGNVYAYDALTGALMWTRNTGQETYSCENSQTFYFGVGGTVAYDPSSKSLYAVGNSNPSPNTVASNTLFHIDGGSGAILGQVNFAPPVQNWPSLDFSHTSVAVANGLAYVGTSATCDISSWRGRVAAVSVPAMTLARTYYTVWNPNQQQPWGGGGVGGWGGVSLDYSGNVLTGVGNTDNGSSSHGQIVPPFQASPSEESGSGDALIKLSPDLSTLLDSQHPIPQSQIQGNSVDLDLTGTPTVFQPTGAGCPAMVAAQAKSGSIYLYIANAIGNGPVAQYALAPSTYADGFLGSPTFSPATNLLYVAVPSSSGSLYPPGMIAISPGCGSPSVVWQTGFGPDSYPSGVPRSVPAVSAGGVVFVGTPCNPDGNGGCSGTFSNAKAVRGAQSAQRKPTICCSGPGTGGGAVWALEASTGNLLNGGLPLITTGAPIRVPPTIDGNWIFVLDNAGDMYGLTIDSNYPAVRARTRSVSSRMMTHWQSQPQTH